MELFMKSSDMQLPNVSQKIRIERSMLRSHENFLRFSKKLLLSKLIIYCDTKTLKVLSELL